MAGTFEDDELGWHAIGFQLVMKLLALDYRNSFVGVSMHDEKGCVVFGNIVEGTGIFSEFGNIADCGS